MIKKLLGAAAIFVLSLGLVVADEFKGKVTKVDGSKVTVKNKTDEKTFDITGAKVSKKAGKDAPEEAAAASDVKEGGFAVVTYEGNKVSKVMVGGGKKKNQ
jgi:hypothetical protein